jgi:hypothetical protein
MAVRERPRLSVAAAATAPAQTVEQALVARRAMLEALPALLLAAGAGGSGGAAGGGSLDFETFAGPFSGSAERHVPRGAFAKFLASVGELVGDASPGEAKAAAYTIYALATTQAGGGGAVAVGDDKLDAKRASALLHVTIDAAKWRELAAVARALQQWRAKYGVTPPITLDATGSAGAGAAAGTQRAPAAPAAGGSSLRLPGFRSFHDHAAFPDPDGPAAHSYAPLEAAAAGLAAAAASAAWQASQAQPTGGRGALTDTAALARAAVAAASGAGQAQQERVDAVWLFARCAQYITLAEAEGGGGASGGGAAWTPEALGVRVLEVLSSHKAAGGGGGPASSSSDAESRLQSALFELLGASGLDFMETLSAHRGALLGVSIAEYRRVASALSAQLAGGPGALGADGSDGIRGSSARPAIGAGVTVVSEADRAADKAARKEARRAGRKAAGARDTLASITGGLSGGAGSGTADATLQLLLALGFPPEYLDMERGLGLASDRPDAPPRGGRGGGAGSSAGLLSPDDVIASVGAGYGGGVRHQLPLGTAEFNREGYKEFVVPPQKPPPAMAGGARLVAVSEMDPLSRVAFKGITRLNRLQSELFHAAYATNENLLVCAPTGAGKTNVAMLAVCHELGAHVAPGVDVAALSSDAAARRALVTGDWKIVYVAPMKALAQEVVAKFSERLSGLGVSVRELTGDMQLTKAEIAATQVIVTTPEKWDVVTRKAGEGDLVAQVRLLIIDEVHLLAEERGAVIESVVARTLRMVETSQSVIRIVGLSATLPNYRDVASFLRVHPSRGLFYFDGSYRPVPLQQSFIGVTDANAMKRLAWMNQIAWDKAAAAVRRGKQVMVFVHSRKDTVKTARALRELAANEGALRLLSPLSGEEAEDTDAAAATAAAAAGAAKSFYADGSAASRIQGEGRIALTPAGWLAMQRDVEKSRNAELRELFRDGFGIHHAGMLRSDRGLSERMFAAGVTKILVCTATLAWGVNLPAHTVIIKGTQVYNAEVGGFTDLGMLDVMQVRVCARAGRGRGLLGCTMEGRAWNEGGVACRLRRLTRIHPTPSPPPSTPTHTPPRRSSAARAARSLTRPARASSSRSTAAWRTTFRCSRRRCPSSRRSSRRCRTTSTRRSSRAPSPTCARRSRGCRTRTCTCA